MIEFSCQHCGALLRMDDSFAGRDGWCRECKCMVVIPSGGPAIRVEDLPAGEAINRLQRLLSYAAKKADLYKQSESERAREVETRGQLESALQEAKEALAGEQARARALEQAAASVREELRLADEHLAHRGSEVEEALARVAAIQDRLEAEMATERALRIAAESELRAAQEALTKSSEALDETRAGAEATAHQVLALSEELSSLRERLAAAEAALEEANESARAGALALDTAQRERDEAERRVAEALGRLEIETREAIAARDALESLRRHLTIVEEERERLARSFDESESRYEGLHSVSARSLEERATLEHVLSDKEDQLGLLTTERDGLLKAVEDGRRESEGLRKQLEQFTETAAARERERDELQKALVDLRESHSKLERDLEEARRGRLDGSDGFGDDVEPGQDDESHGVSRLGEAPAALNRESVMSVIRVFAGEDGVGAGLADVRDVAIPESGRMLTCAVAGRDAVGAAASRETQPERLTFVDRWHREAEKEGATRAQYRLGVRYERGLGVEKDEAEAIRWLTRAAEAGHAGAQRHLAHMYLEGRGVERDIDTALGWFALAADQGDTAAACELGLHYLEGRGVPIDHAEAARHFQRAADEGDARALYHLGTIHASGEGVPQDPSKAMRCFERSAKRGDARAQYEMGKSLRNGTHLTKDDRRAAEWYALAAEQGHPEAQLALGGCYEAGRGVVQHFATAYAWYSLASTSLDIARTARDQLATNLSGDLILEGQVLAAELEKKIEASASAAREHL